ncbi:AraC family transcriptional regulator [Paenibacillus doosanensis]|uniref:helix-turn-helix domain-containing protein n=1 Tax=Paenibacillus doosanensis TaxID=1229154 RepID=UPI002180515D|nr:helix-turn-helix domain-containing protein [Paenibacillus doosanensis]MCS7464115.1 AraC family transcriptional regulator [Paenibacillus doosanensis]
MEANLKKPRGVLNEPVQRSKFTLDLYIPSPDLEAYVEQYWIVKWDLTGQEPYMSEVLPHPSVHMTVEPDGAWVTGVVERKFTRKLQNSGVVLGIKFHPGAFYPFTGIPVQRWTGQTVRAEDVFGADAVAYEHAVKSLDSNDAAGMVTHAETFLRGRMPAHDPAVAEIRSIIEAIKNDRSITGARDIARQFHLSVRMLQRMFGKYVGVSPKWVIQRFRLLEVADKLEEGQPWNWPQFAAELGYYDQSHFIKDFKSIVGVSPEQYVRNNGTGT